MSILTLTTACASSNFTKTGFQTPLAARAWPCDVATLREAPTDRPYAELGLCNSSVPGGGAFSDKTPDGIVELQKCACSAGGNAIILVSTKPSGMQSMFGYSQQRVDAQATVLKVESQSAKDVFATLATPATGRRQVDAAHGSSDANLNLRGRLAVLDLRNFTTELTRVNSQFFTDVVRQATLRSEPHLEVMTRENLFVLLQASGKNIEDCEGECEVETGRRVGADYIVSGEIQKLGTQFKISLRLHATKEGKLVSSEIGGGSSIDELDKAASKAANELFMSR